MRKTSILVGLAALLCTIAATASPANAFFEANTSGATKGPIAKFPETTTFEQKQVGKVVAIATCTQAANTKATGFWNIQTSEENIITTGTKQQQQPGTKVGPHEAITIQKWPNCFATPTGGKALPANVSDCRLQVAQPGKNPNEQEGIGSTQTDCNIFVPEALCTITIPQTKTNHNLRIVTIANEGTNGVRIKANVTGITDTVSGAGCAAAGFTNTTEATFKTGVNGGEAIITAGQKLV